MQKNGKRRNKRLADLLIPGMDNERAARRVRNCINELEECVINNYYYKVDGVVKRVKGVVISLEKIERFLMESLTNS